MAESWRSRCISTRKSCLPRRGVTGGTKKTENAQHKAQRRGMDAKRDQLRTIAETLSDFKRIDLQKASKCGGSWPALRDVEG